MNVVQPVAVATFRPREHAVERGLEAVARAGFPLSFHARSVARASSPVRRCPAP